MRTLHTFFALGAAGLIATAPACTKVQGSEPKPARPVKAEAVAIAPPPAGLRYSATIEPFQQVTLAFKTSGYVAQVAQRAGADGRSRVAQAGDTVSRGTVLARVNEADYRERVTQGRAKLAEGSASLQKARLDLDRAKNLFAAESLTKPDLDAAQANFDAAQARVTSAQAEIELAMSALRDTALIAPATGVLLDRKIEVGTLVGAGSVGFLLGDVSAVKARFGIPDAMISTVTLGDRIGVTIDAIAGATFPGRITALAPAADPHSRVFDVEVTIPNSDGRLRPGMIGTVALSPKSANAEAIAAAAASSHQPLPLVVPLSAVVKAPGDANGYALLVVDKQTDAEFARMRRVQLGEVMGNGIAVLNGVARGDRVIVTGANQLIDGERVRVIP
jgi:RND family efflux transporter MFP subunit